MCTAIKLFQSAVHNFQHNYLDVIIVYCDEGVVYLRGSQRPGSGILLTDHCLSG